MQQDFTFENSITVLLIKLSLYKIQIDDMKGKNNIVCYKNLNDQIIIEYNKNWNILWNLNLVAFPGEAKSKGNLLIKVYFIYL